MSKYLLPIVSLLLHVHSIAQTETRATPAKATFGRYGTNCSSGRGVCSFNVLGEESKLATHARSWKVGTNSIIVEFRKDQLSTEDQIRIAGKPFAEINETEILVFVQQEQFVINQQSLANLEIDPGYDTIEAGNYDMHIGSDKAEIIIQLKASK